MQYPLLALVALLTVSFADSRSPALHAFEQSTLGELQARQSAIARDKSKRTTDAEIRKRMIAESIDSYPGPCACPYQTARNGSRCGRRSAYDREGGYAPLCYPSDVTDDMVADYRRRVSE